MPATSPSFVKLNEGWNADFGAPSVEIGTSGSIVQLRFLLPWAYEVEEDEVGYLTFEGCKLWRFGLTNDEGWYRGQCRYSKLVPKWGEFYELIGEDALRMQPDDWQPPPYPGKGDRHYLFYLKDDTFECLAGDWIFERGTPKIVVPLFSPEY